MTASRRAFLLSAAALAVPVRANEPPPLLRPDIEVFADRIIAKHQLDRDWVTNVLLDARPQPSAARALATPGTSRPWSVFRRGHVDRVRIEAGVRFWNEHDATLQRVRETYGVPEDIVVAIIGIETVFGRVTGTYRVLDALATLGFGTSGRFAFFQSELEEFLLLARDGAFDPLVVRGSYAGAMGWPQFMPSSWRRHAQDFDGDGRIDLWGSVPDIVASVGNYFRASGWQPGADVVLPATVIDAERAAPLIAAGVRPGFTAAQVGAAGVTAQRVLRPDELAALLAFEGDAGTEHWLALPNFHVITRYNRSQNYALAVWQLAGEIRAARTGG